MTKKSINTRLIHGDYDSGKHFGSLTPPIYQTSTFSFDSAEQGERRFSGEEGGYIYSRLGNPTITTLEKRIADLEGGEAGLAFSSGMAAVSSVLTSLITSGDHILVSQGVYGCTFGLLELYKERFSVDFDLIAMEDEEAVRRHITKKTKVMYIETPINPTMKLVDLEMVIRVAHERNITVVVDNTFATPYLQRPLELGADVIVHSATKYIGGHGDVIAGLAVGRKDFIDIIRMNAQKDMGGILGPFEAWLLLRGLKSLALRMDRHCDNALFLYQNIKRHPQVDAVYFPGDPDFPQHDLAKQQMSQFGGLISFTVKGGKANAQKMMNELAMIQIAVSLGDAETLIQHPATMTHAVVPEVQRHRMGIEDGLLRLSAGLESAEDIWADLEQALNK